MTIIEEWGTNLGSVCVVGVYGTNTVVGSIGGLTNLLEACLGTTVPRGVCPCHHAELYRVLFRALDGVTKSKGVPVGQKLSGAAPKPPLVTFRPLTSAELPSYQLWQIPS